MTKDEALLLAIETIEELCDIFMPYDEWLGVSIHKEAMDVLDKLRSDLDE